MPRARVLTCLAPALLMPVLAACGPVTREQAERECLERARLAAGPRGTVAVGASNRGPYASADIHVSAEYIQGRDPSEVYASCVLARSGQPPAVPLHARPDWKG
ncbi:MAG: hypothetical protein N2422_00535 [Rhodobacteraceae bacterium]|nr:hypothetical protein [Paracoccaceae bacterium]